MISVILSEWQCIECGTIFYCYLEEEDEATCPRCGERAEFNRKVKFSVGKHGL